MNSLTIDPIRKKIDMGQAIDIVICCIVSAHGTPDAPDDDGFGTEEFHKTSGRTIII